MLQYPTGLLTFKEAQSSTPVSASANSLQTSTPSARPLLLWWPCASLHRLQHLCLARDTVSPPLRRIRALPTMADAQVPEVLAAERVRQAAREAAIARAQTAVEPAAVDLGQVKEAVKSFNSAVHQVPDYMHIHCSQILDALRILDRVLKDLIAHDCKSPKDASKPVRFAR